MDSVRTSGGLKGSWAKGGAYSGAASIGEVAIEPDSFSGRVVTVGGFGLAGLGFTCGLGAGLA